MKRKIGIALCVLGVGLVIFGIVWAKVVFPNLTKMPADLDQETVQEGTVSVYDGAQNANVTYNVTNSRHYVAVSASKDVVYLHDKITFTNSDTNEPIPSLAADYFLAVDRVTRENVEGLGDGVGGGLFCFPFNVSKDKTYLWCNEGNPENIDGRYVGEKEIQGVHALGFEMSTPDGGLNIPATFDQPAMRIDQTLTMWVDPVTGTGLYMESVTKRTGQIPVPDEQFPATNPPTIKTVTFYEDHLKFTQDTTDDLVSMAKSAKTQINLAKNLLPWLTIGVGAALLVIGGFLALRKGRAVATLESKVAGGA